jgi:hypothetical protein
LEFAETIERRVRAAYVANDALRSATSPEITYQTWLIPLDPIHDGDFGQFRIIGTADISSAPRRIKLKIRDQKLNGRDLCHVAYVLHHELVCHGFQRGNNATSGGSGGAHPTCHWSEGWMDKLAFELAKDWVEQGGAAQQWLPLGSVNAQGAISSYHEARYTNPPDLTELDAKIRRAARQSFQDLQDAFVQNGLARSERDARDLVYRFSLTVNAHQQAEASRLKDISAMLQSLLLSSALAHRSAEPAEACLDFVNHRDILRLARSLQACLDARAMEQ